MRSFFLLFALLPVRVLFADATASAREMMFAHRWEDARQYVEKALEENPANWQAHKLKGDYFLNGRQDAVESLNHYQKAWSLSGGRKRLLGKQEEDDFEEMGERLTRLYLELSRDAQVKAGAAGRIAFLERVITEKRFFSIPIVVDLLKSYDKLGRHERSARLLELVPVKESGLTYSSPDAHEGHLHFFAGRAAARNGDRVLAFREFSLARRQGIEEAQREVETLTTEVEKSFQGPLDEARQAFRESRYAHALAKASQVVGAIPEGFDALRTQAQILEQNARLAIEYEGVDHRLDGLHKEGKFQEALLLVGKTLEKTSADSRLQTLHRALEIKQASLRKEYQEKLVSEKEQELMRRRTFSTALDRARELRSQGQFKEAAAAYKEALGVQADPQVADELSKVEAKSHLQERFDAGSRYLEKQLYTQAIDEFQAVQTADDGYRTRQVQRGLGLAYFGLEQPEKAESHARRALESKEDATLLRKLAEFYESRADSRVDLKRALEFYERLLETSPDAVVQERVDALWWQVNGINMAIPIGLVSLYGLGYWWVKRYPQFSKRIAMKDLDRLVSREQWAKAANLYPRLDKADLSARESLIVRSQFQRVFFSLGQYSKAVSEAQRVLMVMPENKAVRLLHARCLYRMKNISPESLEYYFDLIETEPENHELLKYVGLHCAKKKLLNPRTMGVLRDLADLMPEDENLRQMLIRGYLKEGDRTPRAIKLLEVEKEKNPENIDVRVVLAEYYLKKGEVNRTIEECEELINIELNNRSVHAVLIKAYRELGKIDQLVEIYRSILEADPRNPVVQRYLTELTQESGSQTGSQPDRGMDARTGSEAPMVGLTGEAVRCPKCKQPVTVGSYFCSCGQPL